MRFDPLHRLLSAAVVMIGFAVLYLSGEFDEATMAVAAAAVILGPALGRRFPAGRAASRLANVVVLGAGMVAAYLAFATGNYLYYTIVYAVFLGAFKSFMLRSSADFMQLYVLSFLHVMAGAVVNPGLSFGVAMFPYVVFLTMALMLNNLRRQMEAASKTGSPESDYLERTDLVRPSFLWMTAGVTAAVFTISLVFFFLFPRIGLGFFAVQTRAGISMSGFSDEVRLGDFGNIVEDPEVVMRVKIVSGTPYTPMRMRGQSLDEYDGVAWRKTTKRLKALNMDSQGRYRLDEGARDISSPVVQEVYLEPMAGTPRVLFGMPEVLGFKRPADSLAALRPHKWRFYKDSAWDAFVTGPPRSSIVYTAYSVPVQRDEDELRRAPARYSDWIRRLYLQLPSVDPRVIALAHEAAGRADNPYDTAVAIEDFLESGYAYSLDTDHGDTDPLADFLLEHREGHCEYFASAMVVMLRILGIPSRIVNGFYGGEANQYGGYVALRKADAHSWVEVFFPGTGWLTFDPTPPVALAMREDRSWLRDVSEALDAVKLWWYRWVVEYNLEKQLRFVAGLLGAGGSGNDGLSAPGLTISDIKRLKKRIEGLPWGTYAGTAAVLLLLLAAVLLWRTGRRRAVEARPGEPAIEAYSAMKRLLARRGLRRKPSETHIEFASRVSSALPGAAGPCMRITNAYMQAAWSSRVRTPDRDTLRSWVGEFKLALRAAGGPDRRVER